MIFPSHFTALGKGHRFESGIIHTDSFCFFFKSLSLFVCIPSCMARLRDPTLYPLGRGPSDSFFASGSRILSSAGTEPITLGLSGCTESEAEGNRAAAPSPPTCHGAAPTTRADRHPEARTVAQESAAISSLSPISIMCVEWHVATAFLWFY
ncbi:hypothetical protein B0T16DRAFT_84765 [Cercophora newfieldiana]|uniref:Uncharacterized protein n=1 Tax=Cercophora newfieldiana TaxID=92897 RepID=A0AA39YGV6_9PEZI|nr:hypothetical protein B0T16DRAFT_84765 [Cercophora newfieldiana]